MKIKIDIEDFLILIYWVKIYHLFEKKPFNHDSLFQQAETYCFTKTPLDTNIHPIDDLMIDAYQIYVKLKTLSNKVEKAVDSMESEGFVLPFSVSKDIMVRETRKYERIFEELIENCKFEDPETRGIQKGFLSEKMKECVVVEDYEKAAKLRDMIKEC
jgi:hypothetical protein